MGTIFSFKNINYIFFLHNVDKKVTLWLAFNIYKISFWTKSFVIWVSIEFSW